MHKRLELIGCIFGRLLVESLAHMDKNHQSHWKCQCTCGNSKIVSGRHLIRGGTKSCGCLRKETTSATRSIHNRCTTPEYAIWNNLNQRCCNSKRLGYHNYGGRSITVCERWRGIDGFVNFYEDMGARPTPRHSIDRINNNEGYSKANCRWATRREQSNNRRTNHNLSYNGETRSFADWSRLLGIKAQVIKDRINKLGWSVEKTLTTPARICL
jgi:hypothetical protein